MLIRSIPGHRDNILEKKMHAYLQSCSFSVHRNLSGKSESGKKLTWVCRTIRQEESMYKHIFFSFHVLLLLLSYFLVYKGF